MKVKKRAPIPAYFLFSPEVEDFLRHFYSDTDASGMIPRGEVPHPVLWKLADALRMHRLPQQHSHEAQRYRAAIEADYIRELVEEHGLSKRKARERAIEELGISDGQARRLARSIKGGAS